MIWKFLKQNVLFPKGLIWVQHWVICYLISDSRVRSLYPGGSGGRTRWKFGYISLSQRPLNPDHVSRQKLLMRNYVINMSQAGRKKKSEYPTGIELGLPYTGRMLKPMRYTCTIRRTRRVSWAGYLLVFFLRQGTLFYDPDPFSFCFQINYYFKLTNHGLNSVGRKLFVPQM